MCALILKSRQSLKQRKIGEETSAYVDKLREAAGVETFLPEKPEPTEQAQQPDPTEQPEQPEGSEQAQQPDPTEQPKQPEGSEQK